MSTATIQENLEGTLARIAAAAHKAGRGPRAVRLVADSKTVTAGTVQAAYDCGQRVFGENRAQELEAKVPRLPPDIEWHMIGHLQRNKVRPVVKTAAWIHSVDSLPLVERIDRIAQEEGRCPAILLELNISTEPSKSGIAPTAAEDLLRAALACSNLTCRGLMTMAPFGAPPALLGRIFGGLRDLRDKLSAATGAPLPDLSMGMSADFEVAVAEGATLVRIGTAVFGPRV